MLNLTTLCDSRIQKVKTIPQATTAHHPPRKKVMEDTMKREKCYSLCPTKIGNTRMFSMHVPKSYWGDVVLTEAYIMNRMASRVVGHKAPIDLLSPSTSSSSFIVPPCVFGCVCFVHISNKARSKLDSRALKCIFLGYTPTQKRYMCYYPSSGKRFVSMDVTFHESASYFSPSQTSLQGERSDEKKLQMLPSLISLSNSTLVVFPSQQKIMELTRSFLLKKS